MASFVWNNSVTHIDWFFALGVLVTIFKAYEANPGREFLIALPQNDESEPEVAGRAHVAPFYTTDTRVEVQIYTLDGRFNKSVRLSNGKGKSINLPGSLTFPLGNFRSHNYTIYVEASHDVTLFVRSIGQSNADTYLAFPVNQLETEYIALAFNPSSFIKQRRRQKRTYSLFCFLVVMAATSSGAQVNITLPLPTPQTDPQLDVIIFENVTYIPGDVIVTRLEPLEAVQIQAPFDLTGAFVTSDAPVAAWSGANRTRVEDSCWSHLLEMLPPAQTLGTEYVLSPIPLNVPRQDFRVVARHWLTRVTIYQSGDVTRHILPRPGSFVQYTWTNETGPDYAYLEASKDVMVAVYMSSSLPVEGDEKHGLGDAAVGVLVPVGSVNQSHYRIKNPKFNTIPVMLSIVIEKGHEVDLIFNGEPLASLSGNSSHQIYDVARNADLRAVTVHLLPEVQPNVYDVRHAGGMPFIVYFSRVMPCEGEVNPLAYGTHNSWSSPRSSLVASPSKECPLSSVSEENSMLTLRDTLGKDKCCIHEAKECDCSVSIAQHQCTLLEDSRIADDVITVSATSLFQCQQRCLIHPSCTGLNYGQSLDPAVRCQLLIGRFYGLVSNDAYKFLYCKSQSDFNIGSNCNF